MASIIERNPVPQTNHRQIVLVLYLRDSALDSGVMAWATYDGTGRTSHMAGDAENRHMPPASTRSKTAGA